MRLLVVIDYLIDSNPGGTNENSLPPNKTYAITFVEKWLGHQDSNPD